jgi:uncharacterized membrane protein YhaH (DUF805 family)
MTFGAAIKYGFSNLTNFKGRATRSEFWWYYLFLTLLSIPVSIIIMIVGAAALAPVFSSIDPDTGELPDDQAGRIFGALGIIYGLAFLFGLVTFFLLLAAWVRRLHDAGYSGHWLWLSLPGLGIVPFIFAILDTQNGPNRWGEDPKAAERAAWARTNIPYAAPAPAYGAAPAAAPYGQFAAQPAPAVQPPPLAAPAAPPPTPPSAPQAAPGDPTDPFAAPPR